MPLATSSQDFHALPFPPELRQHIYAYLLTSPTQPVPLYHNNRFGWSQPLSLYPSILLASKTTYTEAVSILYDSNTFKIDLYTATGEGRRIGHADDADKREIVRPLITEKYDNAPRLKKVMGQAGQEDYTFVIEDGAARKVSLPVITLTSLLRMRHLEIVTSYEVVSGVGKGGQYITDASEEPLLALLDLLLRETYCEVAANSKFPRGTLKFIALNGGQCRSLLGFDRSDIRQELRVDVGHDSSITGKIWQRLRGIEMKRNVRVYEACAVRLSWHPGNGLADGIELREGEVHVSEVLGWKKKGERTAFGQGQWTSLEDL
ncbi:MAG: hypothetical protein Q9217_006911 [Psora testacea]